MGEAKKRKEEIKNLKMGGSTLLKINASLDDYENAAIMIKKVASFKLIDIGDDSYAFFIDRWCGKKFDEKFYRECIDKVLGRTILIDGFPFTAEIAGEREETIRTLGKMSYDMVFSTNIGGDKARVVPIKAAMCEILTGFNYRFAQGMLKKSYSEYGRITSQDELDYAVSNFFTTMNCNNNHFKQVA